MMALMALMERIDTAQGIKYQIYNMSKELAEAKKSLAAADEAKKSWKRTG